MLRNISRKFKQDLDFVSGDKIKFGIYSFEYTENILVIDRRSINIPMFDFVGPFNTVVVRVILRSMIFAIHFIHNECKTFFFFL